MGIKISQPKKLGVIGATRTDAQWRCVCGIATRVEELHCRACGKRRWEQLGLGDREAMRLAEVVDNYVEVH